MYRKRPRDDDSCEFMPLSKRINNLHICSNNSQANGIASESGASSPTEPTTNGQPTRPAYDPGFSSSQSSYYFENKLLFQLHLERIQRTGQQFPF